MAVGNTRVSILHATKAEYKSGVIESLSFARVIERRTRMTMKRRRWSRARMKRKRRRNMLRKGGVVVGGKGKKTRMPSVRRKKRKVITEMWA